MVRRHSSIGRGASRLEKKTNINEWSVQGDFIDKVIFHEGDSIEYLIYGHL